VGAQATRARKATVDGVERLGGERAARGMLRGGMEKKKGRRASAENASVKGRDEGTTAR